MGFIFNCRIDKYAAMKLRITKKSLIVKRSIIVDSRSTSVGVEEPFWISLKEIAEREGATPGQLVSVIETQRVPGINLSLAVRVHVLTHFRDRNQTHAAAAPALRGNPPYAPRHTGSPM